VAGVRAAVVEVVQAAAAAVAGVRTAAVVEARTEVAAGALIPVEVPARTASTNLFANSKARPIFRTGFLFFGVNSSQPFVA
jgi:hypothetical protein